MTRESGVVMVVPPPICIFWLPPPKTRPVSLFLFIGMRPLGSRKRPGTWLEGDFGPCFLIWREGPRKKLLPPTMLYRTWSGVIPASTTWLLKFTFFVKLKTTVSPVALPLIVKTLVLVVLKLVTVNTRLPVASSTPALALIVVDPLMAMGVPGSAPSVALSELIALRADVTAAAL